MKKRLKFQCWQCQRTYTLQREINKEQKLFAACPYCNAEAVVDLLPYRKEKIEVFKGETKTGQVSGFELVLPDILPTQPPEQTTP